VKYINQIFILLFFLFSTGATASIETNNNCKIAYRAVLSLRLETAHLILDKEEETNPNNVVVSCIRTYAYFMEYAISSKKDAFEKFEDNLNKSIDALDDEDENSPYRLYYISDLYIESAFANAMESNFITAAYNYRKAYNAVYENYELFPDFTLNKKSLGIMNIGVGSVPKSYTWILNILNLSGNINTGYKQLEEMLKLSIDNPKYNYLFIETLMMYSFTQGSYNNAGSRSQMLENIYNNPKYVNKYKNNQLFMFSKSSYHSHSNNNEKLIESLSLVQPEYTSNPYKLYYLDYMYGDALLHKLDENCLKYYTRYIVNYTGTNYIRACLQKSAWTYLITKGEKYYIPYKQKIIDIGADLVDADKLALKEAESDEIPNVYLLKSRVLFDGGYYAKADSIINLANERGKIITTKDKLEYTYRRGRIYDEWGKFDKAEAYYKKSIEGAKNYKYFYAAKSALQLGYQYENIGKYSEAKKMYELILELDFDEYQNSITQKAKSGLSRLE